MSITFFGIFWIVLLGYLFIKGKTELAIFVTLFSMILQSNNVLILGETGIGPQVLTSLFFIIYSLRFKKTAKSIISLSLSFMMFLIFILYIIKTSGFTPVLAQISVYLICAYCMMKYGNRISEEQLTKLFTKFIWIFIVISILQLLCSIGLLPKLLLKEFLFNDDNEFVQFNKDYKYYRVFSTFMEPSYCSTFLVGAIIFIFHAGEVIKRRKTILIVLIALLGLTFSSTGYGAFVVTFFLYILLQRNTKVMKKVFPVLILLAIFYFLTKDTLLNDILFDKLNSESGRERESWNITALSAFYENPLWGVGFEEIRASSFALSLLATTGIIGTSLFTCSCAFMFWPLLRIDKFRRYEIASRLYILAVLIGMVAACPDLSLCTFWLGFYLVALSGSITVRF